MTNLKRKSVLITGAALGVGRELVYLLSDYDCEFHLIDIRETELKNLKHELDKKNIRSEIYISDLSNLEKLENLISKILSNFSIDIIINNAAIVKAGPFQNISITEHKKIFELNTLSPLQILIQSIEYLKKRPEAHIVQIASIAGFLGHPYAASYGASKWALIGFSEAIRMELEEAGCTNIHMTIVCPSYVNTEMFAGVKPPLLLNFIDSKKLARSIIKAVQKNRDFLFYPWFLKFVPLLRALLPSSMWKSLLQWMRVDKGMKTWKGRS